MKKPILLAIMDGFGLAPSSEANAISLAKTPFLDKLFSSCPNISLHASGEYVGLPDGQIGNSEVGHLNIGAGRVVNQELTRINKACKDGSIEENKVLIKAMDDAIKSNHPIHFIGLLSDGGVHSNIEHLEALIEMAAKRGSKDMRIHAFLDGRDVSPKSGIEYVQRTVDFCEHIFQDYQGAQAGIATISGRYYAMDRDKRWDRVSQAWNAMAVGAGKGFNRYEPVRAVEASYSIGDTDEFMIPTVLDHRGINDGDTLIFFNFRPDRARQITRAFVDEDFDGFKRLNFPHVNFVCLTEYDSTIKAPVAFPKEFPKNTLADVLACNGLKQLHTAETEKYAHVTFFFNGGLEEPKKGEKRVLIPSPKVATYDLQPEMSASIVTDKLVDSIKSDEADVYIVNYANCDMVGHTGVIEATVKAVEAVDDGLSKIIPAIKELGGVSLITADHGNADCMLEEDGKSPHTAHTTAPVPLILVDSDKNSKLSLKDRADAKLADIAPTILDLLEIEKPTEWSGTSLLTR